MAHARDKFVRCIGLALALLVVTGCSGWEPIDVHENHEIPQGPGLVSGEKGGWTIFRITEKEKKPAEQATAESQQEDRTAPTTE